MARDVGCPICGRVMDAWHTEVGCEETAFRLFLADLDGGLLRTLVKLQDLHIFCDNCGEPVRNTRGKVRGGTKFCSNRCRQAVYRRNHPERMATLKNAIRASKEVQ